MTSHTERSTYREKLLEHLFISDLLRELWSHGTTNVDVLRPEVDGGGYDLVVSCGSIIRHIQLKSSHRTAKTAVQKVHLRLGDQPSGCVVWMRFDELSLHLGPYHWFGGPPGERLPDISQFPQAKHTKGNALGVKAVRPNLRVINRRRFTNVATTRELIACLFGDVLESKTTFSSA